MLGVMSLEEALDRADEADVDLILVSPDADPPVCRLMTASKYKYGIEKQKKEASKKQRENRCSAPSPWNPAQEPRPRKPDPGNPNNETLTHNPRHLSTGPMS